MVRKVENPREKREGIRFYKRFYENQFGTYPRESPDILLIAYEHICSRSDLVGSLEVAATVNISPGRVDQQFETERFFSLDCLKLCDNRTKFAEVGRLAANRPDYGALLFHAVYQFALKESIERLVGSMKPSIQVWLERRLGLPCPIIPATLLPENIPEFYHPFFLTNPPPVVVAPFIQEWSGSMSRLQQLIDRQARKGGIVLDI